MTTLNSFTATKVWQELTGVSSVSEIFTIQNLGAYDVLIDLGDTPGDDKAFEILSYKGRVSDSVVAIDNKANTEKVWVKCIYESSLRINKE